MHPAVVRSKLKYGGEEVKFPVVDFDGRKCGGHILDEVWSLEQFGPIWTVTWILTAVGR